MTYFSKLFSTGAIRKTPGSVIGAILAEVEPAPGVHMVEFGAGQGEITYPLAGQLLAHPFRFSAFELDRRLGASLEQQLPCVNVHYEDAFEFPRFIDPAAVDYFVCALPLSFFAAEKTRNLIGQMQKSLKPGGKIIIIFNAPWLAGIFRRLLPGGRLRVFATLPVYGMYVYRKR